MPITEPTFPKILLTEASQPQPYSAPSYEYAAVVRTTAQKVVYSIGGEQKYVLKRNAIAIINECQQREWEAMYQEYRKLIKQYAEKIIALERYDQALEKYRDSPNKEIPNPLSEYIVESQSQSLDAVYAWHIPSAYLLKAVKHTPVMVRTESLQGMSWGLQPQTKIFLIERSQWAAVEEARNAVQAQYSRIREWLIEQAWNDEVGTNLPLPLFANS